MPIHFLPAGGRVGGSSDDAVAVARSFPPNLTPKGELRIGVVDTGFADSGTGIHPWLTGHLDGDPPIQRVPPTGATMLDELDGHGTFVAGLILREAPAATIRMVRPTTWLDSDVSEAIRELRDCHLINLSFAAAQRETEEPALIKDALNELDGNTVVVVAAGNQGGSEVVYPAGVKIDGAARIIAVGAVNETRAAQVGAPPHVASFSNHGSWVDCYASGEQVLGPHCYYVEKPASGVARAPQEFRGWALWSGTSFAAATVTGVIARAATENGMSVRSAAEWIVDRGHRIPVPGDQPDTLDRKPHIRGVGSTWGESTT
jgi:hypothetical protein